MARGGRRAGTPGRNYSNRTDLAAPKPLPIQVATGQPYGEAGAQAASQRAVPMASGPIQQDSPGAGLPPVAGLPPGIPPPGTMPALSAPTDRPDEHLMTGVDAGPGPGVEALTPIVRQPLVDGVAALNVLGEQASPEVKALRNVVNAMLSNQGAP